MVAVCVILSSVCTIGASADEVDLFPTSRVYLSSYYSISTSKPGTQISMCDNNKSTYWATKEASKALGRMIVDLGCKAEINRIEFVTTSLPNTKKNFSIYVTNDPECATLVPIKQYTESDVLSTGTTYSLYPDVKEKYRYLVAQTNLVNLQVGFAEFRVFADSSYLEDNRIINISGQANGYVSSGSVASPVAEFANLNPASTYTTSASRYNKENYIYIDLGKPQKIDSVSLGFTTSSSISAQVTDKEMLRTDFQIVARNDNIGGSQNDTVLIDHKATLAPGVGDYTNMCVLEVPDEHKDEEYRFVGIRKKPTENNNNIGQICIGNFDVYSKVSNSTESFGSIIAKYDSSTSTITANFAARTTQNKSYQIVAAYYDKDSKLISADTSETLSPASETIANQVGSQIVELYYPSAITKQFKVSNPEEVKFAKIFIFDSIDNARPVASSRMIGINHSAGEVQLAYDSVLNFIELPNDSQYYATNKTYSREFSWDKSEGAKYYDFCVSSSPSYTNPTYSERVYTNYAVAKNLLTGGTKYYWRAVADTGETLSGTIYGDGTHQKPYHIKWNEVPSASSYTVYFAEYEDFTNAKIYTTTNTYLPVTNMKLATTYYWKAAADTGEEQSGNFTTTASAPRFITTEGTTNIRDLGGWMTSSGKRVNSNLIYRGAELNPSLNVTNGFAATDADIEFLVNELGIKTEIDLRSNDSAKITESPLGSNVEYLKYNMSGGYASDMKASYAIPSFVKVFKTFADETKYPIYFHCYAGADRTGTVSFLLNGLLGVSYEDLRRDYEMTSYSRSGNVNLQGEKGQKFASIKEYLDTSFTADTLSEEIENYLISIGITRQEIANIKHIMLD